MMSIKVKTKPGKRKVGRPYAGGRDPQVAVRMPPVVTSAVEAWGRKNGIKSRSEAFRALVLIGLESSKPSRKKPKARA